VRVTVGLMKDLNGVEIRVMLKAYARCVAAGVVISAALAVGSLGMTPTAASACPNPNCLRGVPPVAASAMECSEPTCLSGTRPAAAPRPGIRVTRWTGHGGPPARAAAGVSTAASVSWAYTSTGTAINCPPPSRDPGSGGGC